jgi:hypothetical protein
VGTKTHVGYGRHGSVCQSRSWVFRRPGPVITMAAPNRTDQLKIITVIYLIPCIRFSNFKFVECRKSIFNLKYAFCLPFCCPFDSTVRNGHTTGPHAPATPLLFALYNVTVLHCVHQKCSKWPPSGFIRHMALLSASTEIGGCLVMFVVNIGPRARVGSSAL